MSESCAFAPSVEISSGSGAHLHIVYGLQSLDVGGLERIVLDLTRVGRRRGHRVTVICLERPGALAAQVEAEGATVLSLNKPSGRTPWLRGKAEKVLTELAPDVLHTHSIGALWYLGPVARAACQIPVLHTEHIDNVVKAKGWKAKLKMRLIWHKAGRFADRFCCVSDDVSRSAVRWWTVPKSKIETVLNGIDTDRYSDKSTRAGIRAEYGIASGDKVVGTVGRLNEVKSQNLLLQAVAALGPEHSGVNILLVGDGPERQSLEKLANDLGLRSRSHFAGYQQNPERFLPAMDVFALTSRIEGLPLALLEAWAAGLPIVSSAVGGVPKVVSNGKNGLLFPNGDEVALAAALRKILADPKMAARMAYEGQALVREHYSLARMANDYETRYRSLIAARRGLRKCES
jgi:glycosyltransferase involved in cell wall biosynthesis